MRDIAWVAAAGLTLTDEAFHPTVPTLWCNKLRASGDPERIFNAVRAVIGATRVIAGRNRRVLDSTVRDDAVAREDTVTMLVSGIHRVRLLPSLTERVWVREHNLEPGRPPCDWDDPADVDRLVSELVDDANELVRAANDLGPDEAQADVVALLALVAGQGVEPGDGPGRWRIAQRTAPERVISTVDPESCHTHKTAHAHRDGHKGARRRRTGHRPGHRLSLTPGNTGDADAAADLVDGEPAGTDVFGNSAYGTGEFRLRFAGLAAFSSIQGSDCCVGDNYARSASCSSSFVVDAFETHPESFATDARAPMFADSSGVSSLPRSSHRGGYGGRRLPNQRAIARAAACNRLRRHRGPAC